MADKDKNEIKPTPEVPVAPAPVVPPPEPPEEPIDDDDADAAVVEDKTAADDDSGGGKDGDQPIPEELVDRAAKCGLTDADLSEFKDAASLEKTLKFLERKAEKPGDGKTPPKPTADPDAAAKAEAEAEEVIELPEEEFDERIIKVVKTLKDEITNLKKDREESKKRETLQAEAAAEERFDGMVDGLGSKDLFGEGRGIKMDRKSTEFANRTVLYCEMEAIAIGYSQTGREIPSEPELFKKALRSAFPQVESAKLAESLKKRTNQAVSRVASRNGKDQSDKTPEQAAKESVRRILKERNIDIAATDEDSL